MSIPVESAKQRLLAILEQQPEDSSYDELLRELAFARMVDRGLKDIESGRTVGNDDMHREIASWGNQK
jgi:predicted transcriptional regulator